MTFEQLIRLSLMDAVKAAYPDIAVDDKGEPTVCRVLITARDFDRDDSRKYQIGTGGQPKQLLTLKVTADLKVRAALQFHASQRPDLEALFESLLQNDSLIWTWRGYEIRISRELIQTRLRNVEAAIKESIELDFEAPYFDPRNIPLIADASWFDGWQYEVMQ